MRFFLKMINESKSRDRWLKIRIKISVAGEVLQPLPVAVAAAGSGPVIMQIAEIVSRRSACPQYLYCERYAL